MNRRCNISRAHFFELDRDQLLDWCAERRLPRYRADQLLQWVYPRGITDPAAMSNLSKADRDRLQNEMDFETWHVAGHQRAGDGTNKLLLSDGSRQTECVMIPAESRDSGKARRTACISSQVGCPVGCTFCASGIGGLDANLTAGQIVEQVHQLNRIANHQETITNVVFMGMGEPLSNFENVVRAVRTLNAEWAFNLSGRHITISTVGLPAQMRRLADQLNIPVTLAISLHAPNDALRAELIPWAQRTGIAQIIDAGRYYFDRTGREITLEYLLLRHVNDRPEHARQLVNIARRLRCNVNVIRYNEVKGLPFSRPTTEDVHAFQAVLSEAGVNCHLRASRGRDIAAACGQLRHENR